MPREPGYGSKRRQDAEAQRTCREPRPGGPRRTSGDGAWVAPSGAAAIPIAYAIGLPAVAWASRRSCSVSSQPMQASVTDTP